METAVLRCYAEKKPPFAGHAQALARELTEEVGVTGLAGVRVLIRYDVQGLDEATYRRAREIVFSEPQVDFLYEETLPPLPENTAVLAVEALPGQFDQRADSAAQCVQLLTGGERPLVRCATVYLLTGALSQADLDKVKGYLINPVESRQASLDKPDTLEGAHPAPKDVPVLAGFTALEEAGLASLLEELGLAMDLDDLKFLQSYFRDEEGRDPTLTEVRVVDTYWSDHCRHTTFSTHLDALDLQDPAVKAAYQRYLAARIEVYGPEKAAQRPQTLMDMATIGAKVLKKRGLLPELDESEEINACSIHVPAQVDGQEQDWLLMFKNETHNHPTEIEPFGGAATCIGGCIRDPLSGRAYVHQAMRVTGGGDPRVPLDKTVPGKLPQRKLARTAAAGYSSYGNQIGLATGHVAELYHEGYVAKRLECGAVVAAAPVENVRRERPAPGDVVILLGGRTGRDGIGGATGSSKSHNKKSLQTMASEVQKGNAPEERKIQRLFRDGNVTRLIKRCNDFGAGGVSVAIGELADGLEIDLDAVRKKYDGLDGTELAISESQERMAVVVAPQDAAAFIAAAEQENLEAYRVATVTQSPRMVMTWRGKRVADLSRAFLNTNGAVKHAKAAVPLLPPPPKAGPRDLRTMAASLKTASRRGLVERFDGSIGAGSVLMPFGGKTQRTPAQAMAALLPVLPHQETDQASVMAWGCDPEALSANPFQGAYDAVTTSLAKLVAAGADYQKAYLTLQEFFEKLRDDPSRWGKPAAALLGALCAQLDYAAAAIGGKDSMSGTFLDRDVPPTLISFAIAPIPAGDVLSPEFKEPGHPVYLFHPTGVGENPQSPAAPWREFHALAQAGKIRAAWAVEQSMAEGVMKMSFGNEIGFQSLDKGGPAWYTPCPGAILAELTEDLGNCHPDGLWAKIGTTVSQPVIALGEDQVPLKELLTLHESVLEEVYPTQTALNGPVEPLSYPHRTFMDPHGTPISQPAAMDPKAAQNAPQTPKTAPKVLLKTPPKVVIPVFPGTNCEYDSARACLRAGLSPQVVNIRNLTPKTLEESTLALEKYIHEGQILFLPGGFSGGDEPEGSGKFIASFLRNPRLQEEIMSLIKLRKGLILGICNGFQALIKLGLVPYGEIRPMDENSPTLTFNAIGRHQSRYVTTRISSVNSPWMLKSQVGDLHTIPISHGEGKFVCSKALLDKLIVNGQVATQYVDLDGTPSMCTAVNPNGSVKAIEGIFSPDGLVFGKMGHSERKGPFVAKNVPGNKLQPLFESGAAYFQ